MSKTLKRSAEAVLEISMFSSFFIVALAVGILLLPVAFLIVMVMAVQDLIKWMRKDSRGNIPVKKVVSSTAITPLYERNINPVETFRAYSRRVIYTR